MALFPISISAQMQDKSIGINMTTEYGSENQEFQDVLTFMKIDYYKTQFIGTNLKGKNYSLIVKEIWDEKIQKIDTIVNSAKEEYLNTLQSDTLRLRVTAKKVSEKKLKINFRFPQFSNERTYDATESDDYSLRDPGTEVDIKIGKSFYAFAYI